MRLWGCRVNIVERCPVGDFNLAIQTHSMKFIYMGVRCWSESLSTLIGNSVNLKEFRKCS